MKQIHWFVVVGALAALVHLSVVRGLVPLGLPPLAANVFGFLVAFGVSYVGHRRFTFATAKASVRQSLPRFFATALASFALNEALYAILLATTALNYAVALFIVLVVVALVTFVVSKYWAFAG